MLLCVNTTRSTQESGIRTESRTHGMVTLSVGREPIEFVDNVTQLQFKSTWDIMYRSGVFETNTGSSYLVHEVKGRRADNLCGNVES